MATQVPFLTKLPLIQNGHQFVRKGEDPIAEVFFVGEQRHPHVMHPQFSCAMCDAYPSFEVLEDRVVMPTPCPLPNGLTTHTTLAVPSGKIIVTDDLRPIYDWREESRDDSGLVVRMASYNSVLGQQQVIHAMTAAGCAYGPVRNTSPDLYRTGPDTYIIASLYDEDADWDEDDMNSGDGGTLEVRRVPEAALPGPVGGSHAPPEALEDHVGDVARRIPSPAPERLAGICTDLWAYSIADFEDWKSRGGDPTTLGWTRTVVDIRPGVYEFTYHGGEADFDYDAPNLVFAEIKRRSQES
jgi:hypothetical protein